MKTRPVRVIESPWLTSAEAASYLHLSVPSLYDHIREHQLPYGRLGGLYRFDRRELDAWLIQHRAPVRK